MEERSHTYSTIHVSAEDLQQSDRRRVEGLRLDWQEFTVAITIVVIEWIERHERRWLLIEIR